MKPFILTLLICFACSNIVYHGPQVDHKMNKKTPFLNQERQLFIPPNYGSATPQFIKGALNHYLQSMRVFGGMPYSSANHDLYKDNPFVNARQSLYLPYSLMSKPSAFQDLMTLNMIPSQMYPYMALNQKTAELNTNPGFMPSIINGVGSTMMRTGFGVFPQMGSQMMNTQPGSQMMNTQTGSQIMNTQTGSQMMNTQMGSFGGNTFTGSMGGPMGSQMGQFGGNTYTGSRGFQSGNANMYYGGTGSPYLKDSIRRGNIIDERDENSFRPAMPLKFD